MIEVSWIKKMIYIYIFAIKRINKDDRSQNKVKSVKIIQSKLVLLSFHLNSLLIMVKKAICVYITLSYTDTLILQVGLKYSNCILIKNREFIYFVDINTKPYRNPISCRNTKYRLRVFQLSEALLSLVLMSEKIYFIIKK